MSTSACPPIVPAWEAHTSSRKALSVYGYDTYSSRDHYPPEPEESAPRERLRLMAFVDGRLVSSWTERVEESAWWEVARRFDQENERVVLPPPPPPVPTYERVLAWLDDVCGDRDAVLALSAELDDDVPDLPEVDTPQSRARLSAVAELLDAVAASRFDQELAAALRRCLIAVWETAPEVVTDAATAAHVAGGVAWVVTKANDQIGAQRRITLSQLKDALAIHQSPATYGKVVHRALVGYRDFDSQRTGRVYELPDLLQLGRADLLVASTRRTLCRARDRALEAQRASAA